MGNADRAVTLYCAQGPAVRAELMWQGVCFSRREYVQKKYKESAPVFLAAYDWFVRAAQAYIPRPDGAEYPYWAFFDLYGVEQGEDALTLNVPIEEAAFFDMYDWNTVLQLKYLAETEAEAQAFRAELEARGLRETDVMLTNFYPDLKSRVQKSWERLFRHDAAIRAGDLAGVGSVQAALWRIRREWVV